MMHKESLAKTSTIEPYPLLCQPLFKSKIWGGRQLADLFGKSLPPDERIGESWEVADLSEGSSSIANGPLAGMTLTSGVQLHREALLGADALWNRFPLLVKFIAAEDDLSIQVHPDAAACQEHFPEERSKDETWIVIASQGGGRVLVGLQPGTTREAFRRALAAGRVEECLQSIEVKPGDVLRVAPGTVHAIGRGVVVLEIQEPSDTTFRLCDYNRLGEGGKPRELHLEQALIAMHFGPVSPIVPEPHQELWGVRESLVSTEVYSIERWHLRQSFTHVKPTGKPQVVIALAGTLHLQTNDLSLELKPGDAAIIPALLEMVEVRATSAACAVCAAPNDVILA